MKQNEALLPTIGDEFIPQVEEYAGLGYSPERIADLLKLVASRRYAFISRITYPGDTYNIAYREAFADAEKDIDMKLQEKASMGDFDAISALAERSKERIINNLRKELFGI